MRILFDKFAKDSLLRRTGLRSTQWIEKMFYSRKSTKERLKEGDTLIVAETSRLGHSVDQIALIVNQLVEAGDKFICIKENITVCHQFNVSGIILIAEKDLLTTVPTLGYMMRIANGITLAIRAMEK